MSGEQSKQNMNEFMQDLNLIAFYGKVASCNSHRAISMDTEELSKEQRILRIMRKTLGNIVKDVTPLGGRPNPLSDSSIQNIKDCFGLIAARERELAEALNFDQSRPYYADGELPNAKVISIVKPPKE